MKTTYGETEGANSLLEQARADGAADETTAIAGYLRALADGICTAASKRVLRVAANDIERGEHRKVAL